MSVSMSDKAVALPHVAPHRSTALTAFGCAAAARPDRPSKTFITFALRTIMQPLLFVFVFTYVFPKIGQAVGGTQGAACSRASSFRAWSPSPASSRASRPWRSPGAGVRVHARDRGPGDGAVPVWAVALKVAAGALQGLVAGSSSSPWP